MKFYDQFYCSVYLSMHFFKKSSRIQERCSQIKKITRNWKWKRKLEEKNPLRKVKVIIWSWDVISKWRRPHACSGQASLPINFFASIVGRLGHQLIGQGLDCALVFREWMGKRENWISVSKLEQLCVLRIACWFRVQSVQKIFNHIRKDVMYKHITCFHNFWWRHSLAVGRIIIPWSFDSMPHP